MGVTTAILSDFREILTNYHILLAEAPVVIWIYLCTKTYEMLTINDIGYLVLHDILKTLRRPNYSKYIYKVCFITVTPDTHLGLYQLHVDLCLLNCSLTLLGCSHSCHAHVLSKQLHV